MLLAAGEEVESEGEGFSLFAEDLSQLLLLG
jgi:hypothetical protein